MLIAPSIISDRLCDTVHSFYINVGKENENVKSRCFSFKLAVKSLSKIIFTKKLNMSVTEEECLNIQNYTLISNYSHTTTSGGGVTILVKKRNEGKANGFSNRKRFIYS